MSIHVCVLTSQVDFGGAELRLSALHLRQASVGLPQVVLQLVGVGFRVHLHSKAGFRIGHESRLMCYHSVNHSRFSLHLRFLYGLHGDVEIFDLRPHALLVLLQFHLQPGQVLQLLPQLRHRI